MIEFSTVCDWGHLSWLPGGGDTKSWRMMRSFIRWSYGRNHRWRPAVEESIWVWKTGADGGGKGRRWENAGEHNWNQIVKSLLSPRRIGLYAKALEKLLKNIKWGMISLYQLWENNSGFSVAQQRIRHCREKKDHWVQRHRNRNILK